jgi:hypothetical protein
MFELGKVSKETKGSVPGTVQDPNPNPYQLKRFGTID